MKHIRLACLLLSILPGLVGLALADSEPTPQAITLVVAVPGAETPQPEPVPGRTPPPPILVPVRSGEPFTATLTPEATFVPLPKETPDANGCTPTPGPPRATPYPSPEATLEPLPETVLLATVGEQDVILRMKRDDTSLRCGVLRPGDRVLITEERDGWYRVETGNRDGWLRTNTVSTEQIAVREAEHTVLRVGSLNIHGCRRTDDMQAISDTLAMANLDAVGLQEVYRSDKSDWLAKLAQDADYLYYWFSRTMAMKKENDYGIALMSRYPILRAETFRLDGYPGDEPRVLQYAVLLTENGIVHFMNTHISAKEMYIKSVNLQCLVHDVRLTGADSVFMTGDFNCGPPRLIEFWPEVRFANMTVNTYGDGSVPKILDNVLYTGRIRVLDTEYKSLGEATDHALVTAEIIYE